MIKKLIALFIVLFFLYSQAYSATNEWNEKLFNSVKYEKGGVIVDIRSIDVALNNGANPNYLNTSNKKPESVLHHYVSLSCMTSDYKYLKTSPGCDAVKKLFDAGGKLGIYDGSILYFPVVNGDMCVTDILLKNGASPVRWDNATIGTELSPLEEAIANNQNDIASLLISHGVTPVSAEDSLQLRLIQASKTGTLKEIQQLVEMGANINAPNKAGETSLLAAIDVFALFPGASEKLYYIISKGADINKPNRDGEIPLNKLIRTSSYVLNYNKDQSSRVIDAQNVAKKLIDDFIKKGALVSKRDALEQTPLHIAAKSNNLYAAQKLLSAGCKVMSKDFKGRTPLDFAESREMISLLKKYGAKEHN